MSSTPRNSKRLWRDRDVVYANLSGRMEEQARLLVETMKKEGVKRLIFVSSMGTHVLFEQTCDLGEWKL